MKVIALETDVPGVRDEDFTPAILAAESRQVWQLWKEGKIREIHFREDKHMAVITMECEDGREARDILGTLPLVSQGLIAFEVMPLIPYNGFERLFREQRGNS
jgi:hypothetical protein